MDGNVDGNEDGDGVPGKRYMAFLGRKDIFSTFSFIKTAWMTSSPNEPRNKLKDTPKVLAYLLFFVLCVSFEP